MGRGRACVTKVPSRAGIPIPVGKPVTGPERKPKLGGYRGHKIGLLRSAHHVFAAREPFIGHLFLRRPESARLTHARGAPPNPIPTQPVFLAGSRTVKRPPNRATAIVRRHHARPLGSRVRLFAPQSKDRPNQRLPPFNGSCAGRHPGRRGVRADGPGAPRTRGRRRPAAGPGRSACHESRAGRPRGSATGRTTCCCASTATSTTWAPARSRSAAPTP